MAGGAASTDAAAQLVQLREAEALGFSMTHQAGVGYVDAGPSITVVATSSCRLPALNSAITGGFLDGFHPTVDQPDFAVRPRAAVRSSKVVSAA